MKGHIKVTPIDTALVSCDDNADLFNAISAFMSSHSFQAKPCNKSWAVYWQDDEAFKILGYASCNFGQYSADIPVYHVDQGESKQEKWMAAKAHELLFARICGFIADICGSGTQALFYIAPDMQEHWAEFTERMNMKNAHRFVMEVS